MANLITGARILLLPLLWWLALLRSDVAPVAAAVPFLLLGLMDVVDGKVARALGQTSRFGALLDVIGDRLLTLAAGSALMVSRGLPLWAMAAIVVLVGRDLVVSSLGEALGRKVRDRGGPLETAKLVGHFGGMALAFAAPAPALAAIPAMAAASVLLVLGASLAAASMLVYLRRELPDLRA
jgi:phosphatidylglycerophosphate synthase